MCENQEMTFLISYVTSLGDFLGGASINPVMTFSIKKRTKTELIIDEKLVFSHVCEQCKGVTINRAEPNR